MSFLNQQISWANFSRIVLIFMTMVHLNACDPECIYENENYTDRELYVSFKVNGEEKKFYQIIPSVVSGADNVSLIYSSKDASIYRNTYVFNFSENTDREFLLNRSYNGDFLLTFNSGYRHVAGDNSYTIKPSEIFGSDMFFSYQEKGISKNIETTFFMNGISLHWIKNYMSTDNIFIRYNSDKDSILTYFKNSDVKITSYNEECSNYYIIEGTFNTIIETKPVKGEKSNAVILTDGHFRILRQF